MQNPDLSKADSAELRAQYEAGLAEIDAIAAKIEPLKDELVKRENRATRILNAVMAGQQSLLRDAGLSEEEIAAAEEKFQAMRAEKMARNAAKKEAE